MISLCNINLYLSVIAFNINNVVRSTSTNFLLTLLVRFLTVLGDPGWPWVTRDDPWVTLGDPGWPRLTPG